MTWIKICGTTNLEDALTAVDAGADAIGFVFYEKSPRNIEVESARDIAKELPPEVEKVGVFVGAAEAEIEKMVHDAGLTAAQVYAGPSPDAPAERTEPALDNYRLIVALSSEELIPGNIVTGPLPGRMVYALMVDSGRGERPGGTGSRFDWSEHREMIRGLGQVGKVIVAGGLTPDNVGDAMEILQPWGVDVVSGVELCPGKKDPEKVRAFVNAVREADKKAS